MEWTIRDVSRTKTDCIVSTIYSTLYVVCLLSSYPTIQTQSHRRTYNLQRSSAQWSKVYEWVEPETERERESGLHVFVSHSRQFASRFWWIECATNKSLCCCLISLFSTLLLLLASDVCLSGLYVLLHVQTYTRFNTISYNNAYSIYNGHTQTRLYLSNRVDTFKVRIRLTGSLCSSVW